MMKLDISKIFVNFNFLPRSAVGSDTHEEHPEWLKTILEVYLFCANRSYFGAGWSNSGSGLKINRDARNKYTYDLLPNPQINAH